MSLLGLFLGDFYSVFENWTILKNRGDFEVRELRGVLVSLSAGGKLSIGRKYSLLIFHEALDPRHPGEGARGLAGHVAECFKHYNLLDGL